ncbi:MAG TPA: glycerol-3-phosphate acyltransferase, partial [Candidatus Limnocylindrales bacterium]
GSNVMRALGPRLALLSGLLDAAKGAVAVLLAWWAGGGTALAVLAALAAIIGHSRSIFMGFHGGRGVAPSWGALLVLQPWIAVVIVPLFAIVILVTRYSSLGSLVGTATAGILLAVTTYVVPLDPWLYVYAVGGVALVFAFHADNIRRLLAGTERKIGTPKTPSPAD